MEKMQLGSPVSPAPSNYLPGFLLGNDNQQQNTPNRFSGSPTASPEFIRNPQSKFLTGLNTPPSAHQNQFQIQQTQQQPGLFPQQSSVQNNASISGPPTTSLFDCLKNEKSFHTPVKPSNTQPMFYPQDNFLDNSGFNQSRILSPIGRGNIDEFNNSTIHQHNSTLPTIPVSSSYTNFWVTIFGFPQTAVTAVLAHFSQCGSIMEKVCSSGNWMHLKFSSRLESDKALLYNGKIICDSIMIGVLRCTDTTILDKENLNQGRNDVTLGKIRSLTNSAYKAAQEPTDIVLSPNQPKRSTGILNKTLDLFFGW